MRTLLTAFATVSILVLGASQALASGVQNQPTECQSGIGAVGFNGGSSAEHTIVMHLWTETFHADFFRANEFIDNVVQAVIDTQPAVTVATNPFRACHFIGLVDGATRAISEIAEGQVIECTNQGVGVGQDLARLNCALTACNPFSSVPSYATIDVECKLNVDLGCRTGFDSYLDMNRFGTCSALAKNQTFATFVKNTGCNIH
jgi:hypothetical protein